MTTLAVVTALTAVAVFALVVLTPRPASAHCDTEDGPTAADGRRALETANINHALKWIKPELENDLWPFFDKASRVRRLGGEAAEVADRWFLENLVRIHRAGEGAGFDGLKPHGAPVDPTVAAADQALESGTLAPLVGLVPEHRFDELTRRFERAWSLRDFDVDDVTAARAFVDAYVAFFKYAEGEDHEHGHAPGHHA